MYLYLGLHIVVGQDISVCSNPFALYHGKYVNSLDIIYIYTGYI